MVEWGLYSGQVPMEGTDTPGGVIGMYWAVVKGSHGAGRSKGNVEFVAGVADGVWVGGGSLYRSK